MGDCMCGVPSGAAGVSTLHELFLRSARASSSSTALVAEDGTFWTYEELFESSAGIAEWLGCVGVQAGTVVAFLATRPLELATSILGILRAGGTYAPLPSGARVSRLVELVECTRAAYVLLEDPVSEELRTELKARNVAVAAFKRSVTGGGLRLERADGGEGRLHSGGLPPGLAYVMCTSGTTGRPKAVFVPHACALPNVEDLADRFALRPADVVLAASPPGFDPSVVDMFCAFAAGAALLVLEPPAKVAPQRLLRALWERRATVLQCTPAFLRRLPAEGLRAAVEGGALRVLALGGEACPAPGEVRAWLGPGAASRVRLFNLYGTTEVSVWATAHEVPREALEAGAAGPVPLGAPLSRTRLALRLAPGERPVELRYEGGRWAPDAAAAGGAAGELRGELLIARDTASCAVAGADADAGYDLSALAAAGRWAPSGDVACVGPGGALLYDGRTDNLVKVMGQRVRLEDVQAALDALPALAAARVVAAQRGSDGPFLAAFLVPGPGAPPDDGPGPPVPRPP